MEEPQYTLSFAFTFPQYRDFYLYEQRTKGLRRYPWPRICLAVGMLFALSAILCLRFLGRPANRTLFWLLGAAAICFFLGFFLVRFALFLAVNRSARRAFRISRAGKKKTVMRLYEQGFVLRYPNLLFDGLYSEIFRVDRTEQITIFHLQTGAAAAIPNSALPAEAVQFMREKLGGAYLW